MYGNREGFRQWETGQFIAGIGKMESNKFSRETSPQFFHPTVQKLRGLLDLQEADDLRPTSDDKAVKSRKVIKGAFEVYKDEEGEGD